MAPSKPVLKLEIPAQETMATEDVGEEQKGDQQKQKKKVSFARTATVMTSDQESYATVTHTDKHIYRRQGDYHRLNPKYTPGTHADTSGQGYHNTSAPELYTEWRGLRYLKKLYPLSGPPASGNPFSDPVSSGVTETRTDESTQSLLQPDQHVFSAAVWDPKFACAYCEAKYSTVAILDAHVAEFHGDELGDEAQVMEFI